MKSRMFNWMEDISHIHFTDLECGCEAEKTATSAKFHKLSALSVGSNYALNEHFSILVAFNYNFGFQDGCSAFRTQTGSCRLFTYLRYISAVKKTHLPVDFLHSL